MDITYRFLIEFHERKEGTEKIKIPPASLPGCWGLGLSLIQTFNFCIVFFTPYHNLSFALESHIYGSGLRPCSPLSNNRENK